VTWLKNAWYCAGWSTELSGAPIGRTILGEYIVLFRDSKNVASAMDGRCPHRFAPLDKGSVVDDEIMCPYHGLRFNTQGKCVLNPHGDGSIPSAARLKVYPLIEQNGALWIWMGDSALADPRLAPKQDFMVDPAFSAQTGYYHVEANYMLVVDNLLDLTHGPFLHSNTLMALREGEDQIPPSDVVGELEHKVWKDGSVIHSDYGRATIPVMGLIRRLTTERLLVNESDMAWHPPANLEFAQRFWELSHTEGPPKINFPSSHYLTPETEFSTHYFYSVARDVDIDNAEEDDRMIKLVEQAFVAEDGPMVRACQKLMGTSDLLSLNPVILKTDQAAILARRSLQKMIRDENSGASKVP
jgi:phenylpropionate dioxygenase-like ring-hydroxylating dioxygenase large terminal subunit